jgi:hypothetical protein
MNKITIPMEDQTLAQKVGSAAFIASMGAENTGIRTKAQLMHPLREFSDEDSQRESGNLLGSVLIGLLQAMPPQQIDTILKDQAERLSFDE